jgi:hypothetical protein
VEKFALILGIMMLFTLGCDISIEMFPPTFTPSPSKTPIPPAPTLSTSDFHIFVAISGLTNENDQLVLQSGDNETHLFCATGCPDSSEFVQAVKGVIIVYDGFPITYDQWTVTIRIVPPRRYLRGTIEGHIIYKGKSWSCINYQDIEIEQEGQFAYLASIDPVNYDPSIYALPPFSCDEDK